MSGYEFLQRGKVLIVQKRYQDAIKACRLGLLAHPTLVEGRLVLGMALSALQRWDEVLAEMRIALELDPRSPLGHLLKGEALMGQGEAAAALEALIRARDLDPKHPRVGELVAQAEQAVRMGASARRDFDAPPETRLYPAHADAQPPPVASPPPARGRREGTVELESGDIVDPGSFDGPTRWDPEVGERARGASVAGHARELDPNDYDADEATNVADSRPPPTVDVDEVPGVRVRPAARPAPRAPSPPVEIPVPAPLPVASPPAPRTPAPAVRPDTIDKLIESADPSEVAIDPIRSARRAATFSPQATAAESPAAGRRGRVPPREETAPVDPGPPPPSAAAFLDDGRPEKAPIAPRPEGLAPQPSGRHHESMRRSRREEPAPRRGGGRGPDRTLPTPKVKEPRQRRPRGGFPLGTLLLVLVGMAIVAGAVALGLVVRKARLEERILQLNTEAARLATAQTYRGLLEAEQYYRMILAETNDPATQAALARTRAAAVYEFHDDAEEAARLVAESDDTLRDAVVARAYLDLGRAEAGQASHVAEQLVARLPGDAEAIYLLGRALIEEDDADGASEKLRRSIAASPLPLAMTWLAVVEGERGRLDAALATLDEVDRLVPGHPAAVIERARLLAASGRTAKKDSPDADGVERLLEGFVADAGLQNSDPPPLVSRGQAAWAALALAELRLGRSGESSTREALASARKLRPASDPRFSEALITALLRTGDVGSARDEAERAVKAMAPAGTPHLWLARVAVAEGNGPLALEELDKAGAAGARPPAVSLRGRAKLLTGDVEAAARYLDDALAVLPDDRDTVLARAEVDLKKGDARQAIRRLDPLYSANQDPEVAVTYGAALRQAGEGGRARQVLEAAVKAPTGARAYLELARLHRAEGRYGNARLAYERAIEVAPRHVEARLEVAALVHDLGDASGARAALDLMVDESPGDPGVLLDAARLHAMTGDPDGAERLLEQAGKVPNVPRWRVARERGRTELARRRFAQAVSLLAQAIAGQPDDGEARLLLLDAYLAKGDPGGANGVLAEIAKRFFGRPEADLARGRVHLANWHLGPAIASFTAAQKALETRAAPPRLLADARTWLGRSLFYQGDLDKAEEQLESAARLDGSSAETQYALGLVLLEREQVSSARTAFERAIANDPRHADAYYFLADAARRLHDPTEAVKGFETYLKLAPRGEFADEARRLMKNPTKTDE